MKHIIQEEITGEVLILYSHENGWYCQVCGSPELTWSPWSEDGASYEVCSCGIEFGFDDCRYAAPAAVEGIANNWQRLRSKVIHQYRIRGKLEQLKIQLLHIEYEMTGDDATYL